MSRRYSFESDGEEACQPYRQPSPPRYQPPQYSQREPLHQPDSYFSSHNSPQNYPSYPSPTRQSPPRTFVAPVNTQSPYTSPPRSPPISPSAHPDSSFNRLRAARRYSRDRTSALPLQNYGSPASPVQSHAEPPIPPAHRDAEGRIWGRELGYSTSTHSTTTPGADNYSERAAGGITGIALGVADSHARESGMEAMRNTPGYDPRNEVPMHDYHDSPYGQQHPDGPFADPYSNSRPPPPHNGYSNSSLTPLGAAAFPPGIGGSQSPNPPSTMSRSANSFNTEPYTDAPDGPYNRYSRTLNPELGSNFDPNSIEDDGDDGLQYGNQHRSSMLSLGHSDRAAPAAAGAAAGGIMGTIGGLVGRSASGQPVYNPVQNTAYTGAGAGAGSGAGLNDHDLGRGPEKSEWLSKQSNGNKRLKWAVIILVILLIIGGIVGGVVGGLMANNKHDSDKGQVSGESASTDTKNHGVLDKNSDEIKALMNNKGLHRVFPGMDYTPMYTQYPDCLSYPASQNNVTRDVAVLSQLTNVIRLYGTDCNQTELVLEAINLMDMNDTMKVWLGVWQDSNATTNARQLSQMYNILDTYGTSPFAGVIIGNEVLFREDMTETQLTTLISTVRTNLTQNNHALPIASADLGDNWTAGLADAVDILMANIHPFFAGEPATTAANWTYNFWARENKPLKTDVSKQIISETGWPSRGGTDCGAATTCAEGSVAGISEMNQYMDGWVCDALTNGTNYFWFEAFDEPWKWKFNEPGKAWEDQWGLMDVNRVLKDGVVIPDCGGKTV